MTDSVSRRFRDDEQQNFATLSSNDDYARYFNLLASAFGYLQRLADSENEKHEQLSKTAVQSYLTLLLGAVQALRLKYTYYEEKLLIDLSESGFPNFAEIDALQVALSQREERLLGIPPTPVIKSSMLDVMIAECREPGELLTTLSERSFLELLSIERVFLPFVWGGIRYLGTQEDVRKYSCHWGCYDFATNRPYLHLMLLNQDCDEAPLDEINDGQAALIKTIRAEGSRVPPIGVLALAIDQALNAVSPKMIRRTAIGPLFSPVLLSQRGSQKRTEREEVVDRLFRAHRAADNEFILFFSDYLIFSKREERTDGGILSMPRTRQVYALSEVDSECIDARASHIQHNVILPHSLLQVMTAAEQKSLAGFARARKITFGERGELYGI